jgi:hypothetical protein
MGENDKEEQDAFDALELEAKEFDKASLKRILRSHSSQILTKR